MKNFNLHDIMNTAWKIRKAAKITMSEALKKAWRIAKAMVLGARVWEKGSKSRLYLNEAGKAIIGLTYSTYNSGNICWQRSTVRRSPTPSAAEFSTLCTVLISIWPIGPSTPGCPSLLHPSMSP